MHRTDEEQAAAHEALACALAELLDSKPAQNPGITATDPRTAQQALADRAKRAVRYAILNSNATTETSTDDHQHH